MGNRVLTQYVSTADPGNSSFSPHKCHVPRLQTTEYAVSRRRNRASSFHTPIFGGWESLLSRTCTAVNARPFSSAARKYTFNSSEDGPEQSKLTHLTSSGTAHMVNLPPPQLPTETTSPSQHKPPTKRTAIARSVVRFSNTEPLALIRDASLQKGDVSAVARIAGIMAAKRTSELVPLCHNIPLSGVSVEVEPVDASGSAANPTTDEPGVSSPQWQANEDLGLHGGVAITATVRTFGQTGVEMEALAAASVAALTVYDMCKAVDRGMVIDSTRVVLKEGGRSGAWREGHRVDDGEKV